MPKYLHPLLEKISPQIKDRFYGCGSPLPLGLEGKTVLDLGCGTGRDCYLLSQLVGSSGRVIGIDMTDEQLKIAQDSVNDHMQAFGFNKPNVRFLKGFIEDLESLGIDSNSVDVVVSNCVLNLSPQKDRCFKEIFRVLKPGGELYFSDIFSDRRIPHQFKDDPLLSAECLAGAFYAEDFRRLLASLGIHDFRFMDQTPILLQDEGILRKLGMINFYSATIRAFKLDLEDRCENFGHTATYNGNNLVYPHAFILDDHHVFPTGLPISICGNTSKMLSQTRFQKYFEVTGSFQTHFGLFDCGPSTPQKTSVDLVGACC